MCKCFYGEFNIWIFIELCQLFRCLYLISRHGLQTTCPARRGPMVMMKIRNHQCVFGGEAWQHPKTKSVSLGELRALWNTGSWVAGRGGGLGGGWVTYQFSNCRGTSKSVKIWPQRLSKFWDVLKHLEAFWSWFDLISVKNWGRSCNLETKTPKLEVKVSISSSNFEAFFRKLLFVQSHVPAVRSSIAKRAPPKNWHERWTAQTAKLAWEWLWIVIPRNSCEQFRCNGVDRIPKLQPPKVLVFKDTVWVLDQTSTKWQSTERPQESLRESRLFVSANSTVKFRGAFWGPPPPQISCVAEWSPQPKWYNVTSVILLSMWIPVGPVYVSRWSDSRLENLQNSVWLWRRPHRTLWFGVSLGRLKGVQKPGVGLSPAMPWVWGQPRTLKSVQNPGAERQPGLGARQPWKPHGGQKSPPKRVECVPASKGAWTSFKALWNPPTGLQVFTASLGSKRAAGKQNQPSQFAKGTSQMNLGFFAT